MSKLLPTIMYDNTYTQCKLGDDNSNVVLSKIVLHTIMQILPI